MVVSNFYAKALHTDAFVVGISTLGKKLRFQVAFSVSKRIGLSRETGDADP